MTNRFLTAAISAMCALIATAAMGSSRHHARHAHSVRAGAHPVAAVPSEFGEPHMIQVKPGLWISSWGCVTDEGNGRWLPCDFGSTSGRD